MIFRDNSSEWFDDKAYVSRMNLCGSVLKIQHADLSIQYIPKIKEELIKSIVPDN